MKLHYETLRHRDEVGKIIQQWKGNQPLWIHIQGESGSGKSTLIEKVLVQFGKDLFQLLKVNFAYFSLNTAPEIHYFLRNFARFHRKQFHSFLFRYPLWQRNHILNYLRKGYQEKDPIPGKETIDRELFIQLLYFICQRKRSVLILENIFDVPAERSRSVRLLLEMVPQLPAIIISSGTKAPRLELNLEYLFTFEVPKLSVKEVEELVQQHLGIHPINARLITNHLYIKSNGNPRKVKFLLEAVYEPLLPGSKDALLNPADLPKGKPFRTMENLFEKILEKIPQKVAAMLGFLAHLDDPLPVRLFHRLLSDLQINEHQFHRWKENSWIQVETHSGNPFIVIGWHPWKRFLKKGILPETYAELLESVSRQLKIGRLSLPVQVSDQFFELGQVSQALKLAYKEAKYFLKLGMLNRSLDRYAFIRRNLFRQESRDISETRVLLEMGQVQQQLGLYENAFENFREMRDRLSRHQQDEWLHVSLQMAKILLQMDALPEARYLIRELKIKQAADSYIRAFAQKLMGDLEQNQGRRSYALQYYKKALTILPFAQAQSLVFDLYLALKQIYLATGRDEDFILLITSIQSSLSSQSPLQIAVGLDLVKHRVSRFQYKEALPEAVALYRMCKSIFHPPWFTQAILFLAEIEAYHGKWYPCRSHLIRLLSQGWLMPNSLMQIHVMVKLAVVEIELARYGKALDLLNEALEICFEYQYIREIHEIKIHLGHVHLLVHGLLRAREYLREALAWAEENHEEDLQILALLFLSSYEMQQKRRNSAQAFLQKAKMLVDLEENHFDSLNYQYYAIQYFLGIDDLSEAEKILCQFESENPGIAKFENLACWLRGRVEAKKGKWRKAILYLEKALGKSRQYRVPHLEFQVLCDLVRLAHSKGDSPSLSNYLQQTHEAFERLKNAVEDRILKAQLAESREIAEVLALQENFKI